MYVRVEHDEVAVVGEQTWDLVSSMYMAISPGTRSARAFSSSTVRTSQLAIDEIRLDALLDATADGPEQFIAVNIMDGRVGLDFGRYGTGRHTAGDESSIRQAPLANTRYTRPEPAWCGCPSTFCPPVQRP